MITVSYTCRLVWKASIVILLKNTLCYSKNGKKDKMMCNYVDLCH